MSDDKDYKIHKVFNEELDYEILVIELPEDELEDKLTYFSQEEGKITKDYYDDYLLATCIANVNQILKKLNVEDKNIDLDVFRKDMVNFVIEYNPLLIHTKIIINKSKVLKIKEEDYVLLKDEIYLEDNPIWLKTKEIKENNSSIIVKEDEVNNVEDITFVKEKMWWKRIGRYIEVKKYKNEDVAHLLQNRYFHNRTSFSTFVVTVCVIDFEELFQLLDNMGVPSRVAPPLLMHELYELCQTVNPDLTFDVAKDLLDEEDACNDSCDNCASDNNKEATSGSSMGKYADKPKQKKRFKDIPKEDLLNLATTMKVSLIGQDKAIHSLTDAILRASVGLKDPVKPIGSFIFAGSTGCGKSLATEVLADELIKDKDNLVIIDCSEYSADHEYSKLVGCFVPGTKVLMADGSSTNIEKIDIGDKVISHKGKKRKVKFVHEYDQNGSMVKFTTTNSNIPVTTTKTHEIYCIKSLKCLYAGRKHVVCKPTCSKKDCTNKLYKNYVPKWLPASELAEGDIVMYPKVKTTGEYPNKLDLVEYLEGTSRYKYDDEFIWAQEQVKVPRFIEINEDLARLAGYYISEGGSSGKAKGINFTFHKKEHDYILEVVKLIRRIFGKEVRIKIEDRVEEGNSYRIFISSKVICNFFTSLFGHNTYVKHLPVWFNELPKECIKGFLETAVFGDGCTVIPRRMDYSTVSSNLFYQMEQLFRGLGFITYKQLEKKAKANWQDRYRLYIGGNQISKLNDEFNFNIDLAGMEQTNIQRMSWQDNNYQYLQIKKIEKVAYKGKVYDLAVEKDTSYVTEIIVHNSPAGYIGYENGGILTNAIQKNPFSVVVFDEIEKASSKVFQLLLQVLDKGRLTDNKGTKVSFKDTVIIMTSNLGVKDIEAISKTIGFGSVNKITKEKKSKAIEKSLKKKFKPEFLNRVDEIIYFNDLKKKDYERIIDIELYKLNDNLQNNDTEYKSLALDFDNKIKGLIYKNGISEEYGARPLKREIEKIVATPLAIQLLSGKVAKDSTIKVSSVRSKVTFKEELKVEEPVAIPFYMSNGGEEKNDK